MDAIYFGNIRSWDTGAGNGPWVMADMEAGVYNMGGTSFGETPQDLSLAFAFVTAMLKNNSATAVASDGPFTLNGRERANGQPDHDVQRLAAFPAYYEAQTGVDLYAVSAQNEPDFNASYESCLYGASQLVTFIDLLGPKLAALDPPVKVLAAEPDNWGNLWGRDGYGPAILSDTAPIRMCASASRAPPPPRFPRRWSWRSRTRRLGRWRSWS